MQEFITSSLEEKINDEGKLRRIIIAFRYLQEADPKERHFAIRFCNFDEGRGQEVWCIIDGDPKEEIERIATYLLPKDY